jgi:hypothetical protein
MGVQGQFSVEPAPLDEDAATGLEGHIQGDDQTARRFGQNLGLAAVGPVDFGDLHRHHPAGGRRIGRDGGPVDGQGAGHLDLAVGGAVDGRLAGRDGR